MNLIEKLNQHEDQAIQTLRSKLDLSRLSDNQFRELLLQRRLFALHFTPSYEQVLAGLEDEEAKIIIRDLIREEYPSSKTPTHREDIVYDLMQTGLSKKHILTSKPTPNTNNAIKQLQELIAYQHNNYDIIGLITLRIVYEVSVAEEFQIYMQELEKRFGITPEKSRFYQPHFEHDLKRTALQGNGRSEGWISHSDGFNEALARLVDTEEKLALAMNTIDKAMKIKLGFYEKRYINHTQSQ